MKKIFIINGNPKSHSLCRSLAMQYLAGTQSAGHETRLLNIADFDPALTEKHAGSRPGVMGISEVQQSIKWADHLVFVYPNWWAMMPAALKGLLDSVLQAGFAFSFDLKSGVLSKLLRGKSARLLITMDTPRWWYRLAFRNGGPVLMRRAVLAFCGVRTVGVSQFEPTYKADSRLRERWLAKAYSLGCKAA